MTLATMSNTATVVDDLNGLVAFHPTLFTDGHEVERVHFCATWDVITSSATLVRYHTTNTWKIPRSLDSGAGQVIRM